MNIDEYKNGKTTYQKLIKRSIGMYVIVLHTSSQISLTFDLDLRLVSYSYFFDSLYVSSETEARRIVGFNVHCA